VEEEPDPELPEPPETPPTPRPELRLRDLSEDRGCSVCARIREPYVRLEVRGRSEYTCQECATGATPSFCSSCGESLAADDAFCGRCGTPAVLRCPSCGVLLDRADLFCGKCGRSL